MAPAIPGRATPTSLLTPQLTVQFISVLSFSSSSTPALAGSRRSAVILQTQTRSGQPVTACQKALRSLRCSKTTKASGARQPFLMYMKLNAFSGSARAVQFEACLVGPGERGARLSSAVSAMLFRHLHPLPGPLSSVTQTVSAGDSLLPLAWRLLLWSPSQSPRS